MEDDHENLLIFKFLHILTRVKLRYSIKVLLLRFSF